VIVFTIEVEQETDGRWLAEVAELPGVMAYGAGHDEAVVKAQALALRVVADGLEHDEAQGVFVNISFNAA
jgi:predicted RNase H-like HicB family nuclease